MTTSSRAYNSLFNEVYGHFFRSQNTLRTARQNVFTAAEKFPYHTLTADSRKSLIELLSALTEKHIDPTVDFLQKDSMLKFYNYAKDESTPVEKTLKVVAPQLEELKTAVSKTSNDNCLRRENINRRLPTEYNAIITAINDCTRSASMMYRSPINEFTRVHFAALPVISRIGSDLTNCGNNGANRESCVVKFLKTYCIDAADETCKTGSTM